MKSRQLIKEGLRKPAAVKKNEIPPFIDKDEDEDEGQSFDFSKLPSPPETYYKIDTKKPMTKLVNEDHSLIKVIPNIDTSKTEDEVPKIDSLVLVKYLIRKKSVAVWKKLFQVLNRKLFPNLN